VNVDQVMTMDPTELHTQSQRHGGPCGNTSELLCRTINHMVQQENVQQHSADLDRLEGSIYAAHLSPKRRAQLLSLIGKKCTVNCFLDGVPTQALWDTGSQVCLINDKWRKEHLPHTKVRDTEEILGPGTLTGKAVNQTDIPFKGWIEVKFQLEPSGISSTELIVPLLVAETSGVAEEPIIGYNVIEQMVNTKKIMQPITSEFQRTASPTVVPPQKQFKLSSIKSRLKHHVNILSKQPRKMFMCPNIHRYKWNVECRHTDQNKRLC